MTFANTCGACVCFIAAFLWAGSTSKEYLPTCGCCCEESNKGKQFISILVVLIDLIDVILDLRFAITLDQEDKDKRSVLACATMFSFILLVLSICVSVPLEAELERRDMPERRRKYIMLLLTSTFPEMGIFILEDFTFLSVLIDTKDGYDPNDNLLQATVAFSILSAIFAILSYVRAVPFLCAALLCRCECTPKGFLWCLGKILLIPLSLLFPVFVVIAVFLFGSILQSEDTDGARNAWNEIGLGTVLGIFLLYFLVAVFALILIIIYIFMVPCLLFCNYKNSPSDRADDGHETDAV